MTTIQVSILTGLALIIFFLVFYFFLRSALKINDQLYNQRMQIKLLTKLLEKQGATKEEIREILYH
jgi:hypothetical protein